jgi:Kef-type K+ transport system membrane component KefB
MHTVPPALRYLPIGLGIVLWPGVAFAADGHDSGHGLWLLLGVVLVAAKLGGELAARFKQPPVLGELLAGIVLGNLDLLGVTAFTGAPTSAPFAFLAELGVVLLLFEVGLDATVGEMAAVAPASGLVAGIGVVLPLLFGAATSWWLVPNAPPALHLFIGATLSATSVGITARVLRDLGALDRAEARIILGAAVLDDVLGLILLTVASAIAASGHLPGLWELSRILGLALGFFVGAFAVARWLLPSVFRTGARLKTEGVLGALAIGSCLLLAGASAAAGLAPIVGAFAAGLVLDRVHIEPFGSTSKHDIGDLVRPVVAVLAPVFFVRTGMAVDLRGISWEPLVLALGLTVAAIVGKLGAGLGVRGRGLDRTLVGIGMIPRGEVGLIFADVGARTLVAGRPLVTPPIYVALVLMVLVSTVVAPPWLAARLRNRLPAPPVP